MDGANSQASFQLRPLQLEALEHLSHRVCCSELRAIGLGGLGPKLLRRPVSFPSCLLMVWEAPVEKKLQVSAGGPVW